MARMKQTGPRKTKLAAKASVNGASQSPAIQSPAMKSPTQNGPVELSDKDRQIVKAWLDDTKAEFKVTTAPLSRKRKRSGTPQTQTDLFQERLSVQYEVKPRDKWECLRKYKKFTGECILSWASQRQD